MDKLITNGHIKKKNEWIGITLKSQIDIIYYIQYTYYASVSYQ